MVIGLCVCAFADDAGNNQGPKVLIIDSGIDPNHPDLADNVAFKPMEMNNIFHNGTIQQSAAPVSAHQDEDVSSDMESSVETQDLTQQDEDSFAAQENAQQVEVKKADYPTSASKSRKFMIAMLLFFGSPLAGGLLGMIVGQAAIGLAAGFGLGVVGAALYAIFAN